jgi:microcystin-dependent protein
MMFAGNFAPRGWAFCDGQLLKISQNTALFSILGTTYGGDGITTFGLPDLRGSVPMHPGSGPGLNSYQLGEKSGTENVTLNVAQMPSHNHSASASFNEADSASPQNKVWALLTHNVKSYGNGVSGQTMDNSAIGNTGDGQPHTNIQPYLCVNFIIALEGIYPSRD